MTARVRCGLVGLGAITSARSEPSFAGGRTILPYSHAAALARIPRADVVAVCDMMPQAVDAFSQAWGAVWPAMATYSDVNEMLAAETIDVLAICTPDDLHADLLEQAVARGIPAIMCEKPIATTLADADRMIRAVEEIGGLCSIEHTRRWDPYYHRVKELIDRGDIGMVTRIYGRLHGERAMLFRNGTHIVDLMGYYAGAAPARVLARLEDGFDHYTEYRGDGGHEPSSEPAGVAVIEYANGVQGFYDACKTLPALTEWDVFGTSGRIRISPLEARLWRMDAVSGSLVEHPFPATMEHRSALELSYEELFDALHAKDPSMLRSDPRAGRETLSVLIGMLDSHACGNVYVDLQE